MKTKRAFGFYAAALACILSVVALALYGKVLNLDKRTYTFLLIESVQGKHRRENT